MTRMRMMRRIKIMMMTTRRRRRMMMMMIESNIYPRIVKAFQGLPIIRPFWHLGT